MTALVVGAVIAAALSASFLVMALLDPMAGVLAGSLVSRVRARAKTRLGASGNGVGNGAGCRDGFAPGSRLAKAAGLADLPGETSEYAGWSSDLPEMIDVVSLGLSAGISFDAALGMYCDRYRTGLSSALHEAMQSWQLGMTSRREALRSLAHKSGSGAFETFAETVADSLEFGTPLVAALEKQAELARASQVDCVRERIEKAPVKMLVPMATLTLPAMLLAVLGPLMASLASSVAV